MDLHQYLFVCGKVNKEQWLKVFMTEERNITKHLAI